MREDYRIHTGNAKIFVLIIAQLCWCGIEASGWSAWGAWTDCTRACNSGTAYRTRKCGTEGGCGLGESVRYHVCNKQSCTTGASDIRAEQCSTYDSVMYRNNYHTWRPFIDPLSPCSLYCVAERGGFEMRLNALSLDGISCMNKTDHVCLNGKCKRVGCDGIIGSTATMDDCGICSGDGTACREVGYKWHAAGFASCSVSCGEGVQHSTAVCTNSKSGDIVATTHCEELGLPPSSTKKCKGPPCTLNEWHTAPWSPCSQTCGGGLSIRFIYCMETRGGGYRVISHDSYCLKSRPTRSKACNTGRCPVWYTGEWSPCTATCGMSKQYREVICHHNDKYSCDPNSKPDAVRKCTASIPCPEKNGSTRKTSPESNIYDTRPSFYSSPWSPCSVTCDFGVRTRYVECKVFSKYAKTVQVLSDDRCLGSKPRDREDCFERFCNKRDPTSNRVPDVVVEPPRDGHSNKDYIMRYSGFTPCSKTCMRGRQDLMTECVRVSDKQVVNPTYCSGIPGLQTVSRVCNEQSCPPEWKFSRYGNCSERCGGGVKTKTFKCIYYNSDDYMPTEVPAHKCGKAPVLRSEPCNIQPCPPDWQVRPWSKCSVTCGKGVKVRKVLCVSRLSPRAVETVDRSRCRNVKPDIRMDCHMKCVRRKPIIKKRRETYLQLRRGRKVVVRVGGSAVVIPRTTVIVRCPVKHYNRKKIYWLRENNYVPRTGRIKSLRNGALRIRSSRAPADAGMFTCVAATSNASIVIQFHSNLEAKRKARVRKKYLLYNVDNHGKNHVGKHSLSGNGSYAVGGVYKPVTNLVIKDSKAPREAKMVAVLSEWSPCSTTCNGYGQQTREVTCEKMTARYTRLISMHVCRKHGVWLPDRKKTCHVSDPCPRWFVYDWTSCKKSKCVGINIAKQSRRVECRAHNGTIIDGSGCNAVKKPILSQKCKNGDCRVRWQPSEWSECMPDCGETGLKTRRLRCVWRASLRHAFTACNSLPKPTTEDFCQPPKCDNLANIHKCRDKSRKCSLVYRLRMCRLGRYRDDCCKTCSGANKTKNAKR